MTTVRAIDLDQQVDRIATLPVCVVVGEEEILIERSAEMLERAAAPLEQPGSTVKLYEAEAPSAEVFDELRTLPFLGMAGRRAVVLMQGREFMKHHGEALQRYLEKPSSTATLVLVVRSKKLDMRRKLSKTIAQVGAIVQCDKVHWSEAERWIGQEAAGMNCRMGPGAASALLEAVGPNLLGLHSELQKLAAYAGEGNTIDKQAVLDVVPEGRERSIFDLTDAVAARDTGKALKLCTDLLLQGERREMIVGMLARQVRQLWSVRRLQEEGLRDGETGRRLGMPEWLVRKTAQTAGRLPTGWFERQLAILAEADRDSKMRSLRSGEEGVWLDHVLAKLCTG